LLGWYTTQWRTNRWSLAILYNILDIAALAAYTIYTKNSNEQRKTNERRLFIWQLYEELCLPAIQDRILNIQAMRYFFTRSGVECILREVEEVGSASKTQDPPRGVTGK